MPDFKNLKDLEKYLQKAIDNAMQNEVAEAIKEQERESIQHVVYDAYKPKYYKRRGSGLGGLGDKKNMFGVLKEGWSKNYTELTVYNNTPPNPNYYHGSLTSPYIDKAVEYGQEYDYYNPGARGFTEDTAEQLRRKKNHVKALKQGLKRQGIGCD